MPGQCVTDGTDAQLFLAGCSVAADLFILLSLLCPPPGAHIMFYPQCTHSEGEREREARGAWWAGVQEVNAPRWPKSAHLLRPTSAPWRAISRMRNNRLLYYGTDINMQESGRTKRDRLLSWQPCDAVCAVTETSAVRGADGSVLQAGTLGRSVCLSEDRVIDPSPVSVTSLSRWLTCKTKGDCSPLWICEITFTIHLGN